MVTFEKIGINFDVFNNISFEQFNNITNQTTQDFITSIPVQANQVTGGYYGIFALICLIVVLISILTDVSQFGLFRYSGTRALGISFGIAATFGILLLNVGYAVNFIHINIIMTLFIILVIYTYLKNPS